MSAYQARYQLRKDNDARLERAFEFSECVNTLQGERPERDDRWGEERSQPVRVISIRPTDKHALEL